MNELLHAMELARDGDWEGSHNIVQDINSPHAAWIHAYLHRVEGDDGNAGYWYRRAGVEFPNESLADEWRTIYQAISGEVVSEDPQ